MEEKKYGLFRTLVMSSVIPGNLSVSGTNIYLCIAKKPKKLMNVIQLVYIDSSILEVVFDYTLEGLDVLADEYMKFFVVDVSGKNADELQQIIDTINKRRALFLLLIKPKDLKKPHYSKLLKLTPIVLSEKQIIEEIENDIS